MGFFTDLYDKARSWIMSRLPVQDIEKRMGVKFADMANMPELIGDWRDAYQGHPTWLDETKVTLNLPAVICDYIAGKAVSELEITASVGETAQDDVTTFLSEQFIPFIRQELEYAIAMGGVVMLPWYDSTSQRLRIDWYTADDVLPTAWDGKRMMGAVLVDREVSISNSVKTVYTKLAAHGFDDAGVYHIRTKLFKSIGDSSSSQEVSLSAVPRWADIDPDFIMTGITVPVFVYMGTSWANNKSLNNMTGTSIFANAMGTLAEIDKSFAGWSWERESGKAAVFLDESLIPSTIGKDGKERDTTNATEKRMYKKLNGTTALGDKPFFEKWTPELRFTAYVEDIKALLSLACMQMGLDAGAFVWDAETGAITATEIRTKKQRTYDKINDIQTEMVDPAVHDLIEAVRAVQQVYKLTPFPENLELGIQWGDSILTDEETDRSNAQTEVAQGLRSKISYLMDYRGMDEATALKELEQIKTETPVTVPFLA